MKIRDAENKYNMKLVDREHLSGDDVEFWLDQECEVEGKNIYANEGLIGIIA